MDTWYEVLAIKKGFPSDAYGQPVKILLQVDNYGTVLSVQEPY